MTVPVQNVICIIESKTDLSVSALEDSINDWIEEVQDTGNVPVFLAAVRHSNTREELRQVSVADETVAWGYCVSKETRKRWHIRGNLRSSLRR